ncbi:MAG: ATPase, T2SS/T4P/T4SS family [Phycisphaerae bacterium]|nr:ATPase, T2SS/T4P/T4SS family [Phycisphaerae bacterium]
MKERVKKTEPKETSRENISRSDLMQGWGDGTPGLTTLYSPQIETANSNGVYVRDIVETLVVMGRLTEDQLLAVRSEQLKNASADISEILLSLGFVSQEDILAAKAHTYGFEFRHIKPEQIDKDAFAKLDGNFIVSNKIIPVSLEDSVLTVATASPENVFVLDEIKRQTGLDIRVIVCSIEDVEAAIAAHKGKEVDYSVENLVNDTAEVEVIEQLQDKTEDLEKMANESPIIKFVNYIISYAIRQFASDIHIEPKDKETKIRYRIDGVLFEEMSPPAQMHPAIVSRLKIMSNLDISERRLPQDGKISIVVGGRGIDLRVSCLPTVHGEKVVIRILDSKSILKGLDSSGMSETVMAEFTKQIHKPNGILLVTGPTGSGKSTTLYSALGLMDGKKLNISTVEDPVEYDLGFVNQVNVSDRIGMTFAAALRSMLRQDPDIIMVGEIRDAETAKIAVQAALTGHLVLSTLHTNDASSSIARLVNIGVEPYLISASLNAVVAQRLVRKICLNCKEPYKVPDNLKECIEKAGIESGKVFRGKGCDECRQSGYFGRIGIYELLVMDEYFKEMINKDSSTNSMKAAFEKTGVVTLYRDGMEKVRKGITTIDEVLRVTEAYAQKSGQDSTDNE